MNQAVISIAQPRDPADRGRDLILALAAVVMVVAALWVGLDLRRAVAANEAAHSALSINDFQRFHGHIRTLLAGEGTYSDDGFPTPPITLLILAPLSKLPGADAQLAWALCKPLLALFILACSLGMAGGAGVRLTIPALLLVVAAWFWPLLDDLREGQMNLLMLAPLAAGLSCARWRTPAADLTAGVLIALAASIKVTPILLLAYFLLRRRWMVCAAILGGLLVFLLIIPGLGLGFSRNLGLLTDWSRVMILPYVMHGNVAYAHSLSIPSFLTRILSPITAWSESHAGRTTIYSMNVLSLPLPAVRWLNRITLLACAIAGLLWMRRPVASFRGPRYLAEIGLVTAFMLWASERTWFHHYVTSIFLLTASAVAASIPTLPTATRRRALLCLTLCVMALFLTSEAVQFLGDRPVIYLRLADLPLFASILLAAAVVGAKLPEQPLELTSSIKQ